MIEEWLGNGAANVHTATMAATPMRVATLERNIVMISVGPKVMRNEWCEKAKKKTLMKVAPGRLKKKERVLQRMVAGQANSHPLYTRLDTAVMISASYV
jgi:hypothetical protein